MSKLTIPKGYKPLLNLTQTELGIQRIKDFFQSNLSAELRLRRVTAPLFVLKGTGLNDDLNGVERPVSFPIKDMKEQNAEIVHSLAKWKRMILADYEIGNGFGIYTDMNAIRADIGKDDRTIDFLKTTVKRIFYAMRRTEYLVYEMFPNIKPQLPQRIHFVYADDLCKMYPTLTAKEREDAITKEYGAVFIMGIGGVMSNGEKHDGRAPDYDDWTTPTGDGHFGLNGDILVWDNVLGHALELSSMGIRVDKEALLRQLEITGQEKRKELYFHRRLLEGSLPLSIGGGIGQSRLCMFFLRKAHIGEIQASIWPEDMRKTCDENNIPLI